VRGGEVLNDQKREGDGEEGERSAGRKKKPFCFRSEKKKKKRVTLAEGKVPGKKGGPGGKRRAGVPRNRKKKKRFVLFRDLEKSRPARGKKKKGRLGEGEMGRAPAH